MTETITEENTVTETGTVTVTDTTTETTTAMADAATKTTTAATDTATETTTATADTTTETTTAATGAAVAADTSTENVSTAQAAPEPQPVSEPQPEANPDPQPTRYSQAAAPAFDSSSEPEMDPFDKAEKERDSSGVFARFSAKIASIHSRREAKLVRDEIILSRIPDTDLMEYLKLEQKRLESQQRAREIREKRIWIAFQMTVALIAAVLVIYFLKDSPAILISILYTAGLLIAFNIWNKHKDGRSPKDQ